jgi:hypothetical protein
MKERKLCHVNIEPLRPPNREQKTDHHSKRHEDAERLQRERADLYCVYVYVWDHEFSFPGPAPSL